MSEIDSFELENNTIQRCPHDRENPYTMIRNDLIRDQNISPECCYLIIFLLSNSPGWVIKIKYLIKQLQGRWGRDKVYNKLKEAIEAGYIKKEVICNANLRQHVKYYVSETPKFKKSFRHTDFRDVENQNTENTHNKEETSLRKNNIKKEQEEYAPPKGDAKKPDLLIKIKRAENVETSEKEHEKLIEKFGEKLVLEGYQDLSDWKESAQPSQVKKHKSDYYRLRKWVVPDIVQKTKQVMGNPKKPTTKNNRFLISKHFEEGEKYGSAYIYFETFAVNFNSGMNNYRVEYNDPDFIKKIESLLNRCNIKIPKWDE